MPKRTIYIVTEGEYSDYGIRGVFSTQAKAQAYVDGNGGDIEEWGLDEFAGWIKRTHFRAKIRLSDGAILQEWNYQATADPHKRSEDVQQWKGRDDMQMCATSLVSAEHARKLAVEARQNWLREAGNE